jgi:hypothetical protein
MCRESEVTDLRGGGKVAVVGVRSGIVLSEGRRGARAAADDVVGGRSGIVGGYEGRRGAMPDSGLRSVKGSMLYSRW